MLFMVRKGIRCRSYHSIKRSPKINDKFMKEYDKNKESSYLKYGDVNNFYDWAMPQKLFVN